MVFRINTFKMKISKQVGFVLAFLFLAGIVCAQEKLKPYKFKTALVEYVYSGNTTGTQTVYYAENGWNQCEVTQTVTKTFGQKDEKNEVKLSLGLDIYQWTPGAKTGTQMRNTVLEELMKDPNFDPKQFAKELMEQLGFEKKGNETLDGRDCEVWKGLGSTIWIWNELAIKTEVKILGQKTVWTATKIEFDVPVPAEKLKVPSDVKFQFVDISNPMGSMNNATGREESQDTTSGNAEPEIKNLKDLKGLLKKMKNN